MVKKLTKRCENIGVIHNFISYAKKISVEREIWQVAIRPKSDIPLYKGNAEGFYLVPNSSRYWRADPFIIKHNGINYLFVEMFDRKTMKGVIGVSKVRNGKCKRFKVCLDTEFHLSYPCVYEEDNEIYMIPESFGSGEITVYKSVRFPYEWKKVKTLNNIAAVDTTPVFAKNGSKTFFTSLYEVNFGGNDNLYGFEEGKSAKPLFTGITSVRSAGHIIYGKDNIRPVQDDTGHYGNSLIFSVVDNFDLDNYKEHPILRVLPPKAHCNKEEVSVSLVNDKGKVKYIGVHTYNSNEDYEVIDLKISKQYNLRLLWQNRKKIINRYIKRAK